MDIGAFSSRLGDHLERLRAARAAVAEPIDWYLYDTQANVVHLDTMLTGSHRDLDLLAGGLPVADIGAADGDLAFSLEQQTGWEFDIVDNAPTNMNGLRGARALAGVLGSKAQIHDIDLDRQFHLPRDRYGLVLLLGILYHLQNPYYLLRELALHAEHCMLSTRVARFAGPERTAVGHLPVAYLVAPHETNNDATNYWIFTPAGLERVTARAGWEILERLNVGNTEGSDPATAEGDERMFLLLRRRA
jgi:hypothetical protein